MRTLNYELRQLCIRNHDGSITTRSNRYDILQQIANDLHRLGYRQMSAQSLKEKHIHVIVKDWQSRSLSIGTMKNRMSCLRWWASKVNRSVVIKSNASYKIGSRHSVSRTSKAQTLDPRVLESISRPYIRMSLQLQQAFGLRREEAMKFTPSFADDGDRVMLKSSWTKGCKARFIPITNPTQRQLLDQAHKLAGNGSLIPKALSYKQHLNHYEKLTAKAGLKKMHGLRHHYAQQRYQQLTGWPAPHCNGPRSKSFSEAQKKLDTKARLIVSKELGHEREQITAVYLGR